MNNIAMIPAAGRGSRMLSLTDNNPKAMLPLNGKPIIGHQLDFMINNEIDKVVIVVGYKKEKLIKYVSDNYASKIKITFVEQKELLGLAHAILTGLQGLTSYELLNSNLLISLGDIVPTDELSQEIRLNEDFVMYNIVEDYERWCLIELSGNNNVMRLIDKPTEKPDLDTFRNLIGIYNITNIVKFKKCLEIVIYHEKEQIRGEYQISQALEKYITMKNVRAIFTNNNFYHDLGEVEDLNKTRENIARHFNSVKLENGVIVKTSVQNFEKLEKEAKWYCFLPKKLSKYTPELLDIDKNNKNYKLEYIKSTPLQELFLYNLPDKKEWEKIFNQIKKYLELTFLPVMDDNYTLSRANFDMLITKTENRVREVIKIFDENYYTINGKIYKNPARNLEAIFKYVIKHFIDLRDCSRNYAFLHGDLFFGNMMYDIEKEELKLLDPRGDYGGLVNKGDIRYDIAKLNHSVNGYYDFIVNGLYRLENNGTVLNYDFYESSQEDAKKLFEELIYDMSFDKEEIDMLTGLLFLTMIPLHSENKDNQTMQFIKACEFLDNFL